MSKPPSYTLHKPTGQAYVRLHGKCQYLGKYGTPASIARYERFIAEWLAATNAADANTVVELCAAYLDWASGYYVKNGEPTTELHIIKGTIRKLRSLYGAEDVYAFKPSHLKALQAAWIEQGLTRTGVNKRISVVKRIFKWGAESELVPPEVFMGLQLVSGLRKHRTKAPENPPVRPVALEAVEATLELCSPIVRDMAYLQMLSGSRPGEICILRPCDVDRSTDPWLYVPESHKTEHHGRGRMIYLGPECQKILAPYLLRSAEQYCFSPEESEEQRRRRRRLERKSKVPPSQIDRRVAQRQRPPLDHYTNASYRRAIHRACESLQIEKWSPNQLRHTRATELRRKYGLDAARAVLGHSAAKTTEIYAELDAEQAKRVAREIG
jgi:integrase